MATPKMKPAAREGAAGDGAEDRDNTSKNTDGAHRWQVEIISPYSGKPKAWAPPYRTRAEAEIEAAKLRKVRMFCQIRRADGDEREVQR